MGGIRRAYLGRETVIRCRDGGTRGPGGKADSEPRGAGSAAQAYGLVGAWSHRTGQPHGVIHNELRGACGGPAIPQASAEQIQARMQMIRQWALSRRLRQSSPYQGIGCPWAYNDTQ